MKTRTLRGKFTEGEVLRLVVDDGRLNHGYKVRRFVISGDNSFPQDDVNAVLSLDYDSPGTWDWGDNRQIAWASSTQSTTEAADGPGFSLVDPDHVVIMDLYIQGVSGRTSGPINYFVEIEPMTMSNDQAILNLIKERSQDDSR